jgi:hypothetical protein
LITIAGQVMAGSATVSGSSFGRRRDCGGRK